MTSAQLTAAAAIAAALILAAVVGALHNRRSGTLRDTAATTDVDTTGLGLSSDAPTIVHFTATWCGPCKAIAPYVVSECQKQGVNLIKVDVDKNGEIAQKYSIQAMPTFKVIDRNGAVVFEVVGGGQANVNKAIEKAKSG